MATQVRPTVGAPSEIWFTRCPVPTATGIAYKLGWLQQAFADQGIPVRTLQESSAELGLHHYDHRLPTLIREGGNMLSIAARAQGEPTKLIGLTWIEESQAILVRPDSGIANARDLKGKRLALPAWTDHEIPSHVRGCSITRGMSLHGYKGALTSAGLSFDDVDFVEVEGTIRNIGGSGRDIDPSVRRLGSIWPIAALADGRVDAVYVKGASALDEAKAHGVVIGIDLDRLPDRHNRVNNGTPRPITVHQDLIDNHFDYLVRFLATTLRAARWASENLDGLREILEYETQGSSAAVAQAYSNDFHRSLDPTLDDERLALFDRQKKFLLVHGFLDRDFDLASWVDSRPLDAARDLIAKED